MTEKNLSEIVKNVKDSELEDILVESYKSTKVLARVFFPERFYAPFSGLHDQMFDLIDSDAPRVCIAAPRGIGKTSLVALALAAKKILFQDSRFLPYVNQSFDSAVLQTENLKMELLSNLLVKQLFGNVKTAVGDALDKTFSKKSWVARLHDDELGTLIYPRGAGQQIRGLLYRNSRPDFFIIDDLENSEEVLNEDLRRKLSVWFFADLMKAVSRIDKNWRVIYIDTLKHEDALLQKLLDSEDWESILLEICDDDLKSQAPEFVSDEEIRAEYESYKEKGELDVFYRENRNIPISKEDAVFKPEYFKYFTEGSENLLVYESGSSEPEKIPIREVTNVTIVDPAKTVKLSSADTAIITVGIHRQSRKIFVRNVVAGKMEPDYLMTTMFDQAQAFRSMVLAVETTGLDRWISQPIENMLRMRIKKGFTVPIFSSISASASKKGERVSQLGSYYKMGFIYHNKPVCGKLEGQLIMFPRPKLWDCADCLSHLLKVMDEFAYYFDPEDFGAEDENDEFEELYDEDDEDIEIKNYAVV